MSSKQLVADFRKFVEIQKERQAATQELSQILGIDVSFSDEEVIEYAMQSYNKVLQKQIAEDVLKWMK
jgi:hypothetical protein